MLLPAIYRAAVNVAELQVASLNGEEIGDRSYSSLLCLLRPGPI